MKDLKIQNVSDDTGIIYIKSIVGKHENIKNIEHIPKLNSEIIREGNREIIRAVVISLEDEIVEPRLRRIVSVSIITSAKGDGKPLSFKFSKQESLNEFLSDIIQVKKTEDVGTIFTNSNN